jgi:SAM-dependent methyltransferase
VIVSSRPHQDRAVSLLDDASRALLAGRVDLAMRAINCGLLAIRAESSADRWRLTVDEVRKHPVTAILRGSAFTARSVAKPRGYSGDALTMDLIYGSQAASHDSALAADIFAYELATQSCHSVRGRRSFAARVLRDAVGRSGTAVLALACGHLREVDATLLAGMADDTCIVAMDNDAETLAALRRRISDARVVTCHANVAALVRGGTELGTFDLIYTLGLYDYLDQRIARALTRRLLRLLRPGGRLLVANFAPNLLDAGYMEAVMDWWLVYRDEAAMLDLASGCGGDYHVDVYRDALEALVYLDAVKDPSGAEPP